MIDNMNILLAIENTSLWLGWPWMGLGGAVVMIILLFCTNVLRSRPEVSRWRDPLWLAWLAVPMYLLHQFEEYSLHIVDGQYSIVSMFFSPDGPHGRDEPPAGTFPDDELRVCLGRHPAWRVALRQEAPRRRRAGNKNRTTAL